MNEIVKQHNDLLDLPLRKFNASEIDILHAICHQCQNQGSKKIELPFEKIRQLSFYKSKDDDRFYKDIESMGDKLFSLHFKVGTEREYTKFVLFPTYSVSEKNQTLTVKVADEFTYLLNDFQNNYTCLELQESANLKSSYSKGIYKKLRKFRNSDKPFWKVTIADFKEYLDIPKSYRMTDINQVVLAPSMVELAPYFKGLRVEKYSNKKKGVRGRPSIDGLVFTYQAEPKQDNKEVAAQSQDDIAKVTGWVKTARVCPECQRPIYKKQMQNENGVYNLYGHTDWKTGECHYTTYDYADLIDKNTLPDPDEKELSDEQIQNKKRLAHMLGSFFE